MLTRLEFQGINVGGRWHQVVESAMEVAGDASIFFTEPHNTMVLARTGHIKQVMAGIETEQFSLVKDLLKERIAKRTQGTTWELFKNKTTEIDSLSSRKDFIACLKKVS
ncbi:hypothetical protein [Spartinivicinus poritis]|uniref:Uncharacterized protein n=1 Tax=Spartinivicinus poritis TaxID=2994640 RepID=A0ABT5UFZ1_9GAMM|nr:hypothetical protein [Spartinivicinus sp. A2-2]MDE1465303.1 hypothetical protein [Spartinivicinus sp. A2-2]